MNYIICWPKQPFLSSFTNLETGIQRSYLPNVTQLKVAELGLYSISWIVVFPLLHPGKMGKYEVNWLYFILLKGEESFTLSSHLSIS